MVSVTRSELLAQRKIRCPVLSAQPLPPSRSPRPCSRVIDLALHPFQSVGVDERPMLTPSVNPLPPSSWRPARRALDEVSLIERGRTGGSGRYRLARVEDLDHPRPWRRARIGILEDDERRMTANSMENRFMCRRHRARAACHDVEPVNVSLRPPVAHELRPTGGSEVVTKLTTPGGRRTPRESGTLRSHSGVCSAALSTTVQPAASAGATLRVIIETDSSGVMALPRRRLVQHHETLVGRAEGMVCP